MTKITFIFPDRTREVLAQEFLIAVLLSKLKIDEVTITRTSGPEMLGARGQASLGDRSGTDTFDQIRLPISGWENLCKSE